MKKILAIAVLSTLGYGFTVTTKCKRSVCPTTKQKMVQKAASTGKTAQGELDFHPLIFISSTFK